MIAFADSTSPEKIPAAFTHVASYSTGRYVWPAAQLGRFPRHIEIAVEPGHPEQAKMARVLDVERYDAGPSDVLPFLAARRAAGHADGTIYSSIHTIPAIVDTFGDRGWPLPMRWWVAWWWERSMPPTAAEVTAEVKALTGVALPSGVLWACQWQTTPDFDVSVLFARGDDFTAR